MTSLNQQLRQHALPLFCFLILAGLTVAKIFLVPHCLAFDPNDDRNHTFVNLGIAREIFLTGEVPQINFYNNFGTPILGDALSYPFALQALTHYLRVGPLAMTMNRAVLSFFTLAILCVFFRSYFSTAIATLLAAAVFFNPGFLWHFAHHHYQAALLWTTLALLLLRWFGQKKLSARPFLLSLFVVEVLLILGVSINVVAIALAFIVFASVFLGEERWRTALGLTVGSTISAIIATTPQTLSFLSAIARSERITASFTAGTAYEHYNLPRVILGLLTQVQAGGGHIEVALYLSLALLIGAVVGTWFLLRQPETRRTGLLVIFLGLVPLGLVLGLLSLPSLWARLPLLKATDITRFWWFSSVFIALAVGSFLTALTQFKLPRRLAIVALGLALIATGSLILWRGLCSHGISLGGRCGPPDAIAPIYLWGMISFTLLLFVYVITQKMLRSNSAAASRNIFTAIALFVFALALAPNPLRIFHLNAPGCFGSHWFALTDQAQFQPPALLGRMEPFYRLASEDLSSHGQDLTASFNHVLGSNGRSIILDQQFTSYLLRHKLVTNDDRLSGYHFSRPWQPEQLEQLGIRYIIASSSAPELARAGWRVIATTSGFLLYDDPHHPTPFYLETGRDHRLTFVRDYHFHANSAEIILPPHPASTTLVATFVERPGWRVSVDGQARSYTVGDDRLIRLELQPNDHSVRLTYAPYSWRSFAIWFIAGVILLFLIFLLFKNYF